ncbi:Bud site selection protein bud4 [Malassezia obtusa]|uniref:Bud site selection protein bud4 n=1 Tax=Malassezia obtusa TaxID=76774 RepID=A0AAF0ITZ7_9BASI|nr:Bud site selection protein bud4 [Malassezia obtusa]
MLPSLATTDRLVIDDVLQQYSPPQPGEESFDFDVSRDSEVAPAIVDAYVSIPRDAKSVSFDPNFRMREAPIPEVSEELEAPQASVTDRLVAHEATSMLDAPVPVREAPPVPAKVSQAAQEVTKSAAPTSVDALIDASVDAPEAADVPRETVTMVQETEGPKTRTTIVAETTDPAASAADPVPRPSTSAARRDSEGSMLPPDVDQLLGVPLEALPSFDPEQNGLRMPPRAVQEPASSRAAPQESAAAHAAPQETSPRPAPPLGTGRRGPAHLAPPVTTLHRQASMGLGAAWARDELSADDTQATVVERPLDETQATVLERPETSYERQDTSSLLAAERVENLVDELLHDEFLAGAEEADGAGLVDDVGLVDGEGLAGGVHEEARDSAAQAAPETAPKEAAASAAEAVPAAPLPDAVHMVTSPSIRRLPTEPSPAAAATSPPKLASPDLPKLPSWSPITFEGMLPDPSPPKKAVELPMYTVRPQITRDAVRQRMDRRRRGLPVERTPELASPVTSDEEAPSPAPDAEAPAARVREPEAPAARTRDAEGPRRAGAPPSPRVRAEEPVRPHTSLGTAEVAAPPLRVSVAALRELGPVAGTRSSVDEQRLLASPLAQIQSDLKRHASTHAARTSPPLLSMSAAMERQATWFADESTAGAPQAESAAPRSRSPTPPTEYHSPTDEVEPAPPMPRGEEGPFSHLLERELSRIVTESDQKYKVRDRGVFQSNSPELAQRPTFSMQPVDERPWQKLSRPNEVNAYRRISGGAPPAAPGEQTAGRLFVLIDSFIPSGLPLPKEPTEFYCVLDNGIHMVKTANAPLQPGADGLSLIHQEFELLEHEDLEVSFTLVLQLDAHLLELAPDDGMLERPGAAPRSGVGRLLHPFAARGTGGGGRFRSKGRVPPLLHHATRQGVLGRTTVRLAAEKGKCFARSLLLDLPVRPVPEEPPRHAGEVRMSAERMRGFTANLGKPRGTLRLRLFYLPPLPVAVQETLPRNLAECEQGMDNIAWHQSGASYKGTLTQLGGDCKTWRRRPMRIMGLNLICYNEVTKRPTTRIDLMQALSIDDCASLGSDLEDMDEMLPLQRSFRIAFRDGEKIYFFADTDAEMRQWLHVLQTVLTHKLDMPPPWADAAYAAANEFHGLPQPTTRSAETHATSTVRTTVADDGARGARLAPPHAGAARSAPRSRPARGTAPAPAAEPAPAAPRPAASSTAAAGARPQAARAAAGRAPPADASASARATRKPPPPRAPAQPTQPTRPTRPAQPARPTSAAAAAASPASPPPPPTVPKDTPPLADVPPPAPPKSPKPKNAPMSKARQFFSRRTDPASPSRWGLNLPYTNALRPF